MTPRRLALPLVTTLALMIGGASVGTYAAAAGPDAGQAAAPAKKAKSADLSVSNVTATVSGRTIAVSAG